MRLSHILLVASLALGGCTSAQDWANRATSSAPSVAAVKVNPPLPERAFAGQKNICAATDSKRVLGMLSPAERYLRESLSKVLKSRGVEVSFDCPSPSLFVNIRDAGLAPQTDIARYRQEGYTGPVDFGKFSDLSTFQGQGGIGPLLPAALARDPLQRAMAGGDAVYAAVVDVSVRGTGHRLVATVPESTDDWRTELWAGGVLKKLLQLF